MCIMCHHKSLLCSIILFLYTKFYSFDAASLAWNIYILLRLYSPSLYTASLTQDTYTARTWHHPVPRYALDTHYENFYLFYIFFSSLLDHSSNICFDSSYTFTPIW